MHLTARRQVAEFTSQCSPRFDRDVYLNSLTFYIRLLSQFSAKQQFISRYRVGEEDGIFRYEH